MELYELFTFNKKFDKGKIGYRTFELKPAGPRFVPGGSLFGLAVRGSWSHQINLILGFQKP